MNPINPIGDFDIEKLMENKLINDKLREITRLIMIIIVKFVDLNLLLIKMLLLIIIKKSKNMKEQDMLPLIMLMIITCIMDYQKIVKMLHLSLYLN